MIDYQELAVPGVRKLTPYQPGKPVEELQRELGLSEIIKLASNENPLGPSKMALAAVKYGLVELERYPDGNGFALKQKLGKHLSVKPEQITLGNGSNDVLEVVARTFAQPGDEIIFSQYAFAVYPIVTQAIGASAVVIPAQGWAHDLDATLTAITDKTRIIFVTNPNNPTGCWIERETLHHFLKQVPQNIIVVLDEAYFEYANHSSMGIANYPNGVEWLSEFANLIVTRTFSKAYGLAGLRIGYGISSVTVADLLNRVRQPFNVNSIALTAAEAALDDQPHIEKSVAMNVNGMQLLQSTFSKMGLEYIPSAGNFICVDVAKPAASVYQALLKKGVIVRPVANYDMPSHLRITIGTENENDLFVRAFKEVLAST
jgi:histidinol-phosphate aminotransferase